MEVNICGIERVMVGSVTRVRDAYDGMSVMSSRAVIMVIDYCIEFDVVPKYKCVEG